MKIQQLPLLAVFLGFLLSLVSRVSSTFLDVDYVSDMKPSVVLNYLAVCSGHPFDVSSCVAETWIKDTFGDDGLWGNRCSKFNWDEVESSVLSAWIACETSDTDDRNALAYAIGHNNCWDDLCQPTGTQLVDWTWLETCANIALPEGHEVQNRMFFGLQVPEEELLSCMLHETMSSPPYELGLTDVLPGSIEACYPPGFDDMDADFCASIGENVYQRCTASSMGYEFYGYKDEMIDEFCALLSSISSPDNIECLVPLCDYDEPQPLPSTSPSSLPSASPTSAPSILPTSGPTSAPTALSTSAPSPFPMQTNILDYEAEVSTASRSHTLAMTAMLGGIIIAVLAAI